MKTYDVQTIEINRDFGGCFKYIANPNTLPEWTNAFSDIDGGTAILETPQGSLKIKLEIRADQEMGNIDWYMTMPDNSVAKAQSRLVENGEGKTIYSFVLFAPPVPLELLEGALEQQINILAEELLKLKSILER